MDITASQLLEMVGTLYAENQMLKAYVRDWPEKAKT